MSGQSRKMSALESLVNILVGYWLAVLTQIIIFPLFDMRISLADNLAIGGIFTAVSLARSYGLRRFFNWIMIKKDVTMGRE